MQRHPTNFPRAASGAHAHEHASGQTAALQHYLKPAADVLPGDVKCIVGECYVAVSYAARRLGNVQAALEQAQEAVKSAEEIACQSLEAEALAALAMAQFHNDRCALSGISCLVV